MNVVRRLTMVRSQSPYLPCTMRLESMAVKEKSWTKHYGAKRRTSTTESHLLTVDSLGVGDYFGAGKLSYISENNDSNII